MVKEILSASSFYEFLLDQYGNYVIQKSLSVAVEPVFSEFIEKLKPDVERLRQSNDFGVKIYNRLIKQYPSLSSDQYKSYKNQFGGSSGKKIMKDGKVQKNPNKNKVPKNKKDKMKGPGIMGGGIGGYKNQID